MDAEKEWLKIRGERASPFAGAGMGALRVSLLFGMIAVALALMVAPFAENQTRSRLARSGIAADLDFMSTGTAQASGRYTIRRSVLQPNPRAVCVIRDNGSRSGEC